MTTYAQLKSDVETLLPHSDYTDALLASFVRICEAEIRRRVRVKAMETTDTAFACTSESTALPARFISMRSVSLNVADARELDYLPPARLRSAAVYDSTGNPVAYTIEGDNLVLAPAPSSVTLTLVYYAMFASLSDPADTNWLLTNAYDVYLYGSLRAAAEWAMDPEREMAYAAKFAKAIDECNRESRWSRVSGSALVRTGGAWTP
jgi:hypothetical protein